ncbi:preprotein translocase subunit SecE [Alicyclobacillus acidiphilus]|uniref:preprotein translocase subunit SecE n=1 Tax=Alicyclobacillus acidiphilus TaxID=182455 RepID=UPI0008363D9C|nr:preprotein translocase subunit SecE [Alicyclobacillus acidiphilus]
MAEPNDSLANVKEQSRSGFVAFFAESFREMRRVKWPKRHDVILYTGAALVVCAILGVMIWGFDIGVAKVFSLVGVD